MLAAQIEERKQIVRDYLLEEGRLIIAHLALFAEAGLDLDYRGFLEPFMKCLHLFVDPDFVICKLSEA